MPATPSTLPGASFLAEVPALLPALGVAGGVLLWWAGAPWSAALACAIAGTVAMLLRFHHAAFPVICLGAGWVLASLHAPSPLPKAATECSSWGGTVQEAHASSDLVRLIVEVDTIGQQRTAPFKTAIYLHPGGELPTIGDIVHGRFPLEAPTTRDAIPGEPDMGLYALRNGTSATAFAGDGTLTIIGHRTSAASVLARWRARLVRLIAHSGVSDLTFSVVSAILLGYDDEIPPPVRDNFRITGIAHALALSGFHVGIIVMLANIILWPLRLRPSLRPIWLSLTVVLVWLYAALTGFPLSVVRAVIMFSVWMLTLIIGRRHNPFNSLSLAVFIIIAIWPFSIFSAGFQLSVAAVGGLLAFTGPLTPVSPRHHIAFRLNLAVSTPIAAVMGTMPVTAAWFHSLPVLFLIPNIIIALLMPLWMGGGLILLILGAINCPATWISAPLDFITETAAQTTAAIASYPFAEMSGLYLTPIAIAGACAFTITAAIALKVNSTKAYIALSITGALLIGCAAYRSQSDIDEMLTTRANNSSIIFMRHKNTAAAIIIGTPRARDGAIRILRRHIAPYAIIHGVDTVLLPQGDFTLGPYSRRGDTIYLPNQEIILPTRVTRNTPTIITPIPR